MHYAAHYSRLIERARSRVLDGYKERHHIIPKCMGGGNGPENLVDLTAEEHYVAHQLLVQMYPDSRGLLSAAFLMSARCGNNKTYGWLRRRHSTLMLGRVAWNKGILGSGGMTGKKHSTETIEKMRAARALYVMSDETIKKMSAALKGRASPMLGKKHSEATKKKISVANLGRKCPEHVRAAVSKASVGNQNALGYRHSAETLARMSASKKGKPKSAEWRAAMSLRMMGNTYGLGNTNSKGKQRSEQTKAKMSASHTGKKRPPFTEEHRARIGASTKRKWALGCFDTTRSTNKELSCQV